MNPVMMGGIACLGLFLGMLGGAEVGRRFGRRALARDPEGAHSGTGVVEGAVFGLLGLLLAFTFAGAASRFESRRGLVVDEANAIGTAYLRLDLLPAEAQAPMRERFRRYLEARIEAYEKIPDLDAVRKELARVTQLQDEIWSQAVEATRGDPGSARLLLPSLNEMIDITTTRTRAAFTHVPSLILGLLFGVALIASVFAGYAMSARHNRNVLHAVLFAAATAATIYIVIDLEYPRVGLIRLDAADQVLIELRDSLR